MKNNKKGFTLVELLVVIAILAILATVAVVGYMSFIDRANQSVDQQLVEQMNITLQADEVLNGKPATVVDAKNILVANRLDDFTPIDAKNVFYWVGTENRVILWSKDEADGTTGRVTYPEDYVEKFADYTEPSSDWADLSLDYSEYFIEVEPEGDESLRSALLSAVQNATDGAVVKLPKNSTVDLGAGGLYFLGSYLTNEGGTGKALTIDLNGSTIESLNPHSNGYYYGISLPDGASLTLLNGSLDAAGNINTFEVGSGSNLILRNVNVTTAGDGIYPDGNAGEIILDNCELDCGADYGIATNNQVTDNLKVTVNNSTIKANSCAVLVNVPCDVSITDSEIIGGGWGVFIRSGHATIENTTIKTTDGDIGADDSRYNTSCENFVYNSSDSNVPYWGQGAQVPYAPIIIGDYSSHDSYNHDTDCALINVKIENANSAKIPDVVLAARSASKDVVFNYDNATNVGRTVIFGEGYIRDKFIGLDGTTLFGINHTFNHEGTITVNGTVKNCTNITTVVSPIKTETFSNRYTIPVEAGTFEAYTFYSIEKLSGDVLEAFKAHYTSQGLNLTDAQWETVQFAAGSTANVIKTITYDSSAE